jgi:hypothetical protein
MACDNDRQTCSGHCQPELPPPANYGEYTSDLERVAEKETPAIERTAMLRSVLHQKLREAVGHVGIVEMRSIRVDGATFSG